MKNTLRTQTTTGRNRFGRRSANGAGAQRRKHAGHKICSSWIRTAWIGEYALHYLLVSRNGEPKTDVVLLLTGPDGRQVPDARVTCTLTDRLGRVREVTGVFWEGGYLLALGRMLGRIRRLGILTAVAGRTLHDDFSLAPG
ncbi:hypothetical protein DESUT3_35340 [Desulfuromonas versatilis]|uniref:Uncharacterized protein n=1 Tax=Desulfuromonas versatilis TaxID=2802975 RepID=A0ABN6E2A0_9BACT|nr:hypothetical protein [Desulfuromonas versatilis]BCR06465.1 hypothetical protein DESUT3_35340 [Desulfuromonas versatilis]